MPRLPRFSTALACTALCLSAGLAQGADGFYRLTSQGAGQQVSLDVGQVPTNAMVWAMMLPTGVATGQYSALDRTGKGDFRLSNVFTGPQQCLDVAGDGALYMDRCGRQIGQRWQLQEVPGQGVKLTNAFKPGQCLDVVRATTGMHVMALLAPCSGSTNQVWTLGLTGRN